MAEVRRLGDLDSLRDSAQGAQAALAGGDGDDVGGAAALDLLGESRARLEAAEDPALRELGPRLDEAIAVVTDVAGELSGYLSDLPSDPGVLETLLGRQAELKSLTRKYAADIDGVLAWARDARDRLSRIDVSADAVAELAARADREAAATAEAATALTAARRKAADKLAKAVSKELSGLAMGRASLDVQVRDREAGPQDSAPLEVGGRLLHAGTSGVDDVEFRLAAHSGARSLPIARSASGGELSRVMLALEVVLAGSERGATMVFDEVDAGVGGRAAVEIGRRLARLSRTHQVIVVTHLPQALHSPTPISSSTRSTTRAASSAAGCAPSPRPNESPNSPACSPVSATPRRAGPTPRNCSPPRTPNAGADPAPARLRCPAAARVHHRCHEDAGAAVTQ